MFKQYDAAAWFWIVDGDESQIYSSAQAGFVAPDDPAYLAFLDAGGFPSRINSIDELRDVLLAQCPAGWTPTLAELRTSKNAEINTARAAANSGTFVHDGKTFTCDALSRSDIDGVNGYIALFDALPPAFPGAWKAADNSYYLIADVAAWKGFYASMVAAGAANFAHSQQLKTALAAATTAQAIAAIVW